MTVKPATRRSVVLMFVFVSFTAAAQEKPTLLVIDGDPLQSAIFLRNPRHVVKNGVIVK